MTTTSRRKDVAWGLFVDDESGGRDLRSRSTRKCAEELRGIFRGWGRNPGRVFKIVGPRAEIRVGRGRG